MHHGVAAYFFGKIGPEPCEKSGSTLIATPSVSSQLSAALVASDEDWVPINGSRINLQVPELNILPVSVGIMTIFDIAPDFPIRIMLICDVALDLPTRAHYHPEFPRFNLRAAQSWANDRNVVLSADRGRVKPVKRRLFFRTDRLCCWWAESPNKILFGRLARSDLVDLLLCDRFVSRCVTRQAGER